jgi:hypothetical protein
MPKALEIIRIIDYIPFTNAFKEKTSKNGINEHN